MDIVTKPRGELVPYENNPRHNDEAVEYVANSIKEFGWKVPVVIDKNNVVVAGHTRLKAAEMLGVDEIPCIIADDLSEDQIKAYRLADNKVGELAGWDFDALDFELDEIELDMSEFGFDVDDFDNVETEEDTENIYTSKVDVPQYEPSGENVDITDRPFQFYGRLNEDVTAYTYLGQQGKLFLQVADWCLNQGITQANKGGLTDAYLDLGTYVKTFYSIMYSPSCIKVSTLGDGSVGTRHERIHHNVNWTNCIPMIINEKWKRTTKE